MSSSHHTYAGVSSLLALILVLPQSLLSSSFSLSTSMLKSSLFRFLIQHNEENGMIEIEKAKAQRLENTSRISSTHFVYLLESYNVMFGVLVFLFLDVMYSCQAWLCKLRS